MFYIYRIQLKEIGNRCRLDDVYPWDLSVRGIFGYVLSRFLDGLEKYYPKTNFLKTYFCDKYDCAPYILISDKPIENIKNSIFYKNNSNSIPYVIKVNLKLVSKPEDYNTLDHKVRNTISNIQYLRNNYYINQLLTSSIGWYSFGPDHKKVFENKLYWKIMSKEGGGL